MVVVVLVAPVAVVVEVVPCEPLLVERCRSVEWGKTAGHPPQAQVWMWVVTLPVAAPAPLRLPR